MFASVGLLVAIALLIYLAFKGVNILIVGPLASVLIILFNQMDFMSAFFQGSTSYMGGLGSFIANYLLIFVLGAVLGKFLEDSGAALSIANGVLRLFGKEKPFVVVASIAAISALLSYGGVNAYIIMFSMIAIAKPLYEELDIPWHMVLIPIVLGGTSFTMTMFPGTPAVQNAIPTTVLGTTLTAAPLMGIFATLVTIAFGLFYIKWQLNAAASKGEHFADTYHVKAPTVSIEEKPMPSLTLSLAPMVVLIAIILVGSAYGISNILIPALIIGILACMLLLRQYIPKTLTTLNGGVNNSIGAAIFTAAAVGVGTVAAAAPGFQPIMKLLVSIPGGTFVEVATVTSFMAAVTGSPGGALGIVMQNFGADWLATGVSPEAIHRIASVACGALGAMPHNGVVFAMMALTGLTHKQCYKHIAWIMVGGGVLSLLVSLIMALMMY